MNEFIDPGYQVSHKIYTKIWQTSTKSPISNPIKENRFNSSATICQIGQILAHGFAIGTIALEGALNDFYLLYNV